MARIAWNARGVRLHCISFLQIFLAAPRAALSCSAARVPRGRSDGGPGTRVSIMASHRRERVRDRPAHAAVHQESAALKTLHSRREILKKKLLMLNHLKTHLQRQHRRAVHQGRKERPEHQHRSARDRSDHYKRLHSTLSRLDKVIEKEEKKAQAANALPTKATSARPAKTPPVNTEVVAVGEPVLNDRATPKSLSLVPVNDLDDEHWERSLDEALKEDAQLAGGAESKSFHELGKEVESQLPRKFMDQFMDPFNREKSREAEDAEQNEFEQMHSIQLPGDDAKEAPQDVERGAPALPTSTAGLPAALSPVDLAIDVGGKMTVHLTAQPRERWADIGLRAARLAGAQGLHIDPGPLKYKGELLEEEKTVRQGHLPAHGSVIKMAPHPIGTVGARATETGLHRVGKGTHFEGCSNLLPLRCTKWLEATSPAMDCDAQVRVAPDLVAEKAKGYRGARLPRHWQSQYHVWQVCAHSCGHCGEDLSKSAADTLHSIAGPSGPGSPEDLLAFEPVGSNWTGAGRGQGAWWKQVATSADHVVAKHYDAFFATFLGLVAMAVIGAVCLCCAYRKKLPSERSIPAPFKDDEESAPYAGLLEPNEHAYSYQAYEWEDT